MNDLIDRYVAAVADHLPADSRDDVALELRGTIADMLEDRGDDSPDAVRSTLLELGDPAALATEYRGGPRHLIGPDYYREYLGVLKPVLATALPVLLAIQLVGSGWFLGSGAEDDRSVVEVLVGAVGGTLEVGVHILFWVTLVFVILERTGASLDHAARPRWTPDDLPQAPRERQITMSDFVASVVILALIPLAVLWQRVRSPFEVAGDSVPILDPDLWGAWIPALFAIVVLNVALEVWKYRSGTWTPALVGANLALNVVFVGYFVALFAAERVWNPQYVDELARRTDFVLDGSVVEPVTLAVVAAVCAWDSIDSVVKARRARRAPVLP